MMLWAIHDKPGFWPSLPIPALDHFPAMSAVPVEDARQCLPTDFSCSL
jgi:hypothetical protein